MNQVHFVLFVIASLLAGCTKSTSEVPKLSKEAMTYALIRIHLADSKASRSYMAPDSALMVYANMEDSIFDALQIDKSDFNNSYKYYLGNIGQMEEIYTHVIDSLALREAIRDIGH